MLPRLLRSARVAARPTPIPRTLAVPRLLPSMRAYSALPKLKDEDDAFVGTPAGTEAAKSKIADAVDASLKSDFKEATLPAAEIAKEAKPPAAEKAFVGTPAGKEAAKSKIADAAKATKKSDFKDAQLAADDFFTPEILPEAEAEAPKASKPANPDAPNDANATAEATSFASLKGKIDYDLLKALTVKPFQLQNMSEVQRRVLTKLPELITTKREDLLVKAKTGTGKTIAFLAPAICARPNQIEKFVASKNPADKAKAGLVRRAALNSEVGTLIITPTRELATQIANEARKLLTWQKERQVQLFVGGMSRQYQLKDWRSIRRGAKDIVVATPGRLRDLLSEPDVAEALGTTDVLVLDEADTLLEMGFANDLNFIVDRLPKSRQTFLFSATVSKEIQAIAERFLKPEHDFIDCVPKNESNVHDHIPQHVTVLGSAAEQLPHLVSLIYQDQLQNPGSKVIVFLPTTKQTMLTATLLRELRDQLPDGLSVHEIHSRLTQERRSRSAEKFRRDTRASVLVTSDVSARGVDYPGVTRVIQVGIPSSADQYVHRVGRTGRGGKTGGRGDLVLLPFEAGFTKQLAGFPVAELSHSAQLAATRALATRKRDEAQLAGLPQKIAQLLPALDPEAVNDVFMSLLGYYMAKGEALGQGPQRILAGLNEWATAGAGLPQEPHLSHGMRLKFGLAKAERRAQGGPRGGRDRTFGISRERADAAGHERRFADRPRGRDDRFGGDRPRFRDDARRTGGGGFPSHNRGDRPPRGDRRDGGDRPPRREWSERPPREGREGRDRAPREGREGRDHRSGGYDRGARPSLYDRE